MRPLSTYKIGDELEFKITLSRAGYYKKTVLFSHKIKKIGAISIHQYLNVTLDVAQTLVAEDGTESEKKSPIYTDKEDKLDSGVDLAKVIDIEPICYDLSKWNIRPDAALELDKIISVMNKYPSMEIELGSHTDCRSSRAFNQNLSDKRAKSSAYYIQSKITNPNRIKGRGYGESKLVNDCGCEGKVKSTCYEEEHQANRRTEFIIQKM